MKKIKKKNPTKKELIKQFNEQLRFYRIGIFVFILIIAILLKKIYY